MLTETTQEEAPADRAGFGELGLSEASLGALRKLGYTDPTPIQRKAIPPALEGSDVLGSAQTGTGKTAAFSLPMIQRLAGEEGAQGTLRGLVVTPTRELAQQVERAIRGYAATTPIESTFVHGGVPIGPQIRALEWGCDILVATPGRLLDHMERGTVSLGSIEVLVLDEADRMLDMGFIDDVRRIVAGTPDSRQTLLFSATIPDPILYLASQIMREPVRVQVGLEKAAEGIEEVIHPVDRAEKHELLLHLLESRDEGQILVFTRRRDTTSYLADYLRSRGLSVDDLHGGKSQADRTQSLQRFREGGTRILVATNVAARGLDIRGIRHVVNFDVPEDPRDYVHRVGRTARADETGDAITLMSPHEWLMVRDIEKLTGEAIERQSVEGFEPSVEPLDAVEPTDEEPERPRSRLSRGRRRR
ncbi:MAG TPA: DEAD/DEAH box helicase [Gemmatimonadota bacterium]|nr:DEAD/DEAH box helicase [Gemmatimonadota bacterium]